jgi:hypothetical protein
MTAQVHAPETTGLIEMSAWSFHQFPAFAEESFPAVAADATSICIDGVAFRALIDPRL